MNQELMPCKCGNSIIDQKKTGSLTSYQCPACGISWRGALIVAAPSKTNAFIAFVQHEAPCWETPVIRRWDGVTVAGETRVLYDDVLR